MPQSFEQTLDLDRHRLCRELDDELVKLMFSMSPVVLAANLINGTLIAAVFFRSHPPPLVAVWWLLTVILIGVRSVLWFRYRRQNGSSRRWLGMAIAGSAISGVLWGAAGFAFFPSGSETQRMVLGLVLGGMGAGAVTALTPCLPAFYAFLFPAVVPFCVQIALNGDTDHLTMAAACVLYLIALTILGRRANMWLKDSMLRRFENAELVRSLERRVEERTTKLKQVNERLHHDIAERTRVEAVLAKHGDRQAAIADFGRLALSGIDLDELFGKAAMLVRDKLEVASAAVIEQPADAREVVPRAAISFQAEASTGRPGATLADHPQRTLDATATIRSTADSPADLGKLAELATSAEAVISHRDRPFGILVAADASPRTYTENDVNFLQSIANMLAAAIERKGAEHDIQRLALRDSLTGLPNRELFREQLQQELAQTQRSRHMLAVLLLDLDNFKDVNDTLGHPIGDRLLVAVAKRLKSCLRAVDAPARLGGDEFAIILSELRAPEDAAVVARKVVDGLSEPFQLDGHELHIGASAGITVSPCDGSDVDGLLRNADLALYRAKSEGRNTHRFYAADMALQVEARKALETDLRQALDRGELFLLYQPLLDLKTRRPIGAEALLRWRHPTRGVLLPDEFIPVAEAMGLIVRLGRWVLERVAEQILEWRRSGLPPIPIATNISLSQCRRGDLVATIEDIAARTTGDLDWLELEVTEHLFLPPGSGDVVATLQHLRDLGVTISIDDFGTGYSSLGRLRHLPVDKIKIDKSFIAELVTSRDAEMLVRAIITLAKSLGMTVTAEGVENDRQIEFLIAEGCDSAQGYQISWPLPQRDFAAMLRNAAVRIGPLGHGEAD